MAYGQSHCRDGETQGHYLVQLRGQLRKPADEDLRWLPIFQRSLSKEEIRHFSRR